MLKIKDNVDLKELEKFGFELDECLSDKFETVFSVRNGYQKLCFFKEKDRMLYLYEPFNSNVFLLRSDILYDLIKADLVEKVVE